MAKYPELMTDISSDLGQLFWQFELGGVPLLPRLVARGRVGEIEGEWWLKTWGERLLFCTASAPDKVFAVVTPCVGETDLAAFWRAAVEREDYGIFLLHCERSDEVILRSCVSICSGDDVWLRDWCGGEWLRREDTRAPYCNGWSRDSYDIYNPPFAPSPTLSDLVNKRDLLPLERHEQPLLWLRGSQSERQSVLQACATLCFARQNIETDGLGIFYAFAHAPFFIGWSQVTGRGGPWRVPPEWRELFRSSFVLVGWRWKRCDQYDENTRAGWEGMPAYVSAHIQLTRHPSHHQQLEARLTLRDWLQDKVPADQIARLIE